MIIFIQGYKQGLAQDINEVIMGDIPGFAEVDAIGEIVDLIASHLNAQAGFPNTA